MKEQPLVSVICLAYNHEKYIRQCLDSIVSQKTDFSFEIIVHDDASTDSTTEIIREFEKKFPKIVKPIYQIDNQYSKNIDIEKEWIVPKVQGEYVAFCECDDFWCDDTKLQQQVDALREHPDCRLCVHKVQRVKENGITKHGFIPPRNVVGGILNEKEVVKLMYLGMPFHLSSTVRYTEDLREYCELNPEFKQVSMVGDVPAMLYWGQLGKTIYFDRVLSCYRMNSETSWSNRIDKSMMLKMDLDYCCLKIFEKFDEFTKGRFHGECVNNIEKYKSEIWYKEQKIDKFRNVISNWNKQRFYHLLTNKKIRLILHAIKAKIFEC